MSCGGSCAPIYVTGSMYPSIGFVALVHGVASAGGKNLSNYKVKVPERKPPAQKQTPSRSQFECAVQKLESGGVLAGALSGIAAIASGAPIVPKSWLTGRSGTLSSGSNPSGGRTSVISAISRGLIGGEPKLKPGGFWAQMTNTGKVASAVGRVGSRLSIAGGLMLEGLTLKEFMEALEECSGESQ